jgi:acyl-CoA hydrolase
MNIPCMTAQEAAALVCHGDLLGIGGFGPAGSPKCIPPAIAEKATAASFNNKYQAAALDIARCMLCDVV